MVAGNASPLPGNLPVLEARLDGMADPVTEDAGNLAGDEDVPHRVAALGGVPRDLAEVEVLPDPHARADPEPVTQSEGPGDSRHEIEPQAGLALAALPGPVTLGQQVRPGVAWTHRIGRGGARIDQRRAEQLVDAVDPLVPRMAVERGEAAELGSEAPGEVLAERPGGQVEANCRELLQRRRTAQPLTAGGSVGVVLMGIERRQRISDAVLRGVEPAWPDIVVEGREATPGDVLPRRDLEGEETVRRPPAQHRRRP